MTVYN